MNEALSQECRVKVPSKFAPLILLVLEAVFIAGFAFFVFKVWFPVLSPYVNDVIGGGIYLIGMLASLIAPFVILVLMFPFQRASVDSNGLTLSRKGRIAFEGIASYDTDAVDFGMKGRLYLHIRPQKGFAYRLIAHPRDRQAFYELCLTFKRYADARITNGPAQKSFWGSPAARIFGIIGLLIEAVVTAMVIFLAPHMLGYVAFLLVVGTPMFLLVILGKRAN